MLIRRLAFNIGDDVNTVHKKTLVNCIVKGYNANSKRYILETINTPKTFEAKGKDILPGHYYIIPNPPQPDSWSPPQIGYTMKEISFI